MPSSTELSAYCDQLVNINNLQSTNNQEPFFDQDEQVFCQQQPIDSQLPTTSTMLKSDLTNLNCYSSNLLNQTFDQTRKLNNQLINSQMVLNNQNSFTQSTNRSPIKHLNQFKSTSNNSNLSSIKSPSNEWLDTVAHQVLNGNCLYKFINL